MRFKKPLSAFANVLFSVNVLAGLYTLVAYLCVYVSPVTFWPAGFLTLSVPVALFVQFLFVLYWLLMAWERVILPVTVLLVGFPLFDRTYAVNREEPPPVTKSFRVLSFNARLFNLYRDGSSLRSNEIIHWVTDFDADIKCIQEFYNLDNSQRFNTISKISEKGDYEFYMTPLFKNMKDKGGFVGVAIFSKFPIVNQGDVIFGENTLNKGVYVDLKIEQDTVRIFNVHLHSMSIKTDSLFETGGNVKENYLDAFYRLRRGFITRGNQVQILKEYVRTSPYQAIVCGDFNDVPYSYTYQQMRQELHNAFEDAGNGFGFTYNGKLFFLRIDNQFYDERLAALNFTTHRNVPYSDHFPVSATYGLRAEVAAEE